MAVNSLLFLLLTAGLPTPPDQSVTSESAVEYTSEFPYGVTEDTVQGHEQTKWPGYGERTQDASLQWRQEPQYSTENPSHQYTDLPESRDSTWESSYDHTEDSAKWSSYRRTQDATIRRRQESRFTTERPSHQYTAPPVTENVYGDSIIKSRSKGLFEQTKDKTPGPYESSLATEEPQLAEETRDFWGLTTEEPERETVRPESRLQKKGKRKCPPREHFSKCHKNCEKTCSDYMKRKPCPRSCKKGCVCDGGLVRNKEGRCVPRDRCPKNLMAEDDDSHGCPYEYACDVHCVTKGMSSGHCEGNTCKCSDR